MVRTCRRGSGPGEVRQLISRPQEIIFCGFMPVIWVLIVWGLLYNGVITDVPVAYVDHDNTSMSREIGRALDADRTMGLVTYNSHDEALGRAEARLRLRHH